MSFLAFWIIVAIVVLIILGAVWVAFAGALRSQRRVDQAEDRQQEEPLERHG